MMEVKSIGPWPKYAIKDINSAIYELHLKNIHEHAPPLRHFVLLGLKKTLAILNHQISGTAITYATFLTENDILKDIVRYDSKSFLEDGVVIHGFGVDYKSDEVRFGGDSIKILNVEFQKHTCPTDYTDEELHGLIEKMLEKYKRCWFTEEPTAILAEALRRLLSDSHRKLSVGQIQEERKELRLALDHLSDETVLKLNEALQNALKEETEKEEAE